MANSCTNLRSNLAFQTPVYDKAFLADLKPMDSCYIGRHETGAWEDGTGDTHFFDRITVAQPNLTTPWGAVSAAECGSNACNPPRTFVSFGTQRSSYSKEQIVLTSQLFCLDQLRNNTNPQAQVAEILRGLKKMPEMFTTEFLRNRAAERANKIQIAGSSFAEFTPTTANTEENLTLINLTSTGLPTSQLTWSYLNYITSKLSLQGYYQDSQLPRGMFNLITDPRSWFLLSNGSSDIKQVMALDNPQAASALYKIGYGIQQPFGNIAPSLDELPPRFQVLSGSMLQRVYPYTNANQTTGTGREINDAWVKARYQLSYIWHPKAIKVWTEAFDKINPLVPSVNNAMYGQWTFVNPNGAFLFNQPDGTQCTMNGDLQNYFYWLCRLVMAFEYKYPELIMPIIHLVDGNGFSSTTDLPVCGSAPQYTNQSYSSLPVEC